MPTGYTAPVLNGATFEEFVWDCARAFVPDCKEDDGPIELPLQPEDQYRRQFLAESQQRYDRCQSLTDEQLLAHMRAEYEEARRLHAEAEQACRAENEILSAMMAKVEAWQCPEEAEHVKAYMLDQLKISMHSFYEFDRQIPSIVNVRKYRKDAEAQVKRYEASLRELHDRYAVRNEWLAKLAQSVPPTGKGKLR